MLKHIYITAYKSSQYCGFYSDIQANTIYHSDSRKGKVNNYVNLIFTRNWEECLLFFLLVTPRTRETMSSEQPGTCDRDVETVFWRDVIQRNQSRSANVYGMTCIPALSERSRCFGCPKSRDDPRVTKIVDRLFYVQIIQISRTDAAVFVPSKKSFPDADGCTQANRKWGYYKRSTNRGQNWSV